MREGAQQGAIGGGLAGAGTGAAIGSMILPGYGTAIGAGIGLVVGGVLGGIAGNSQEKAQDKADAEAEQARVDSILRSFGAQQQALNTAAANAQTRGGNQRGRTNSQEAEGVVGAALSAGTAPQSVTGSPTSGTF